ncbi:TPA: hypothetical protein DCZ81_03900 [Candidatus Collierbacteria bacterium]|nr:hypothetical protein [Candidatus Collierbacteria bacterium]HCX25484.1 hypothetical protein [Candidatus Collierbacteria bacterium]
MNLKPPAMAGVFFCLNNGLLTISLQWLINTVSQERKFLVRDTSNRKSRKGLARGSFLFFLTFVTQVLQLRY